MKKNLSFSSCLSYAYFINSARKEEIMILTTNALNYECSQEFFIRHIDGTPISSEAEKQRVILCLRAAIERRASEVMFCKLYLYYIAQPLLLE